ncbi:MAG: enoyl-CoA hydratase [Alphaproteobacteria bacterium]|nr:enoyl-CoA hydratase [Alphaproteobacteria bacterium]
MTTILKTARVGAVLRLTLNDTSSRNSLSEAMLAALESAVYEAQEDPSIGVIVFAADGPAFSAGHNLKELTAHRADLDQGAAYFAAIFSQCGALMSAISRHRCVTIAEVQGLASAAGCQLVASCDMAIASDHARFCTPGVNIGLFCSTPMVALSRAVSPRHAREMLLTGDIYDAQHALRIGLVNEVVQAADLTAHVQALAEKIASKSRRAIEIGKPTLERQSEMGLEEAYSVCARTMVENFMNEDAREGVGAVLEKRKAVWPSQCNS